MKVKWTLFAGILFVFTLGCLLPSFAEEPASIQQPAAQKETTIQLPNPQKEGGKPLMSVLNSRMSTKAFGNEKVSPQILSNLLWAAFGINRPDGRRTAPSAKNCQEIDIYVITAEGAYLWDAAKNTLNAIVAGNIRSLAGTQAYVKDAPVDLIYVADYSKTAELDKEGFDKALLSWADTGLISENVYLFCASEGLGTVVRARIDRDALAKELKLKPDQKIILAQSVGYKKQ